MNPFSEPLPKKEKPEITRKPIRGKKTSLDRLMDMEKHHKKLEPGKSEFDHVDENLAEEMRTNVYAIAAEESRKARESAPAGMGERTAKKDAKKTSGKKL